MRCPKCGAFLNENQNVCSMCGVDINAFKNGFNQQTMSNNGNSQSIFFNNQGFNNSGSNNFGNANMSGINSTPQFQNGYMDKADSVEDRNRDYRNVDINSIKNTNKDMFDFYNEHRTLINFLLVLLVLFVIGFAGYKYFMYRTTPLKKTAVINDLYFKVDEGFSNVSENQSQLVYTKSGNKGAECSITVISGTSTSENHVKEYNETVINSLNPNVGNNAQLEDFIYQEGKTSINSNEWYYLNIYYKDNTDFTHLKYRHLVITNKGYFYDIELANNINDLQCSGYLDNFTRSLEFVEE